jgi:hypothetical protein
MMSLWFSNQSKATATVLLMDLHTLANLKVAEGVNPQDILDQLETTTQYMADYYRSK